MEQQQIIPIRDLYLFGEITTESTLEVIQQIHILNNLDNTYEDALNNYEREPIILHINSGGGDVTAGFSLISEIITSVTPIVGIVTGECASMALAIFASCHIKISSVYARYMYHSITYGIGDKLQGHVEQLEEAMHLQKMYDSIILKNTSLQKKTLEQIQKEKRDYWFGAKHSIKIGLSNDLYEVESDNKEEELQETQENE